MVVYYNTASQGKRPSSESPPTLCINMGITFITRSIFDWQTWNLSQCYPELEIWSSKIFKLIFKIIVDFFVIYFFSSLSCLYFAYSIQQTYQFSQYLARVHANRIYLFAYLCLFINLFVYGVVSEISLSLGYSTSLQTISSSFVYPMPAIPDT